MNSFQDRLPRRREIVAVLSIAVFVCFSWSIFGFFNKLSSFLLYFTLGEIAAIFAYMMTFALLESLAVTGLLVLAAAVLPGGWLREGFGCKGFIVLVAATASAILLQRSLENVFPPWPALALFILVPIAASAALIAVLRSRPRVQDLLAGIQDRFLVMLFIYVPIGVLSMLAVTVRNLF